MLADKSGVRLDQYLTEKLDISRSKVQKLIEEGKIAVNGNRTRSNYKIHLNDEIEVLSDLDFTMNIEKEDIPLDILYEDDFLLVVNKESGMVVHPAAGNFYLHHTRRMCRWFLCSLLDEKLTVYRCSE